VRGRSGLWLWLLPALWLGGCASDKGLISHSFNNIAARDNAYFIAREKLKTIETALYKERVNDYNAVLPLFPTLDSTNVRANRAELNDIIKKASMPIQHRPGSDWTDNAYLLVAWARFYKMEFDDAALTFKYVNTTSKDPNARHEALIGLMRTFVYTKQFDNAKAVSDLLDKEVGRPEDARELFLTRADYYLKTESPALAIAQLERAIPLIKQKNERSRTRFILAQLYQNAGDEKKAYAQLNEILKRNPPYELDFQSKLMLGQVSELNSENQARLDKYFAKLLKDPKNLEYRDKIYYEMARVNYRKQQYPAALALLNKSVRTPSRNQSQKSYTYLLAGRIYYENLQRYRLAAAYYDSTVQNLNKEAATYAAIKERSEILTEFAKQYTIIETQDSLQALARLAPDALNARLNQFAAAEIEVQQRKAEQLAQRQKEQARADELAARGSNSGSTLSGSPSALAPGQRDIIDPTALAVGGGAGGVWYFDNPSALTTARSDFQRRFGNRPLQDNWRTNSTAGATPGPAQQGGQVGAPLAGSQGQPGAAGQLGTNGSSGLTPPAGSNTETAVSPEAAQSTLVAQYQQSLPDTPEKMAASNEQIEAALYALGTIYKEQLKERQKGYDTYAAQVARFPRGAHAADAYYLLYLHYKDLPDAAKTAEYAAALQREFPTSLYAKLIADPRYRENELALHNAVAVRLDSAFSLYKKQEFTKARAVLTRTAKTYPKSDLADRLAYMTTLLAIRTQPPPAARASVETFIKQHPGSPLVPQAQALASTYQKYEANQIVGALASTEKPAISVFRPGEVDNRMRIFYQANETPYVAATPDAPAAAPAAGAPPAAAPGSAPRSAKSAATPAPAPLPPAGSAPASGSALGADPAGGERTPAPSNPATPPAGAPPVSATSAPTTAAPTTPAPVATNPEPAAAPATAYTTQLSAMHAVVLVFPKSAPAAPEVSTQFAAYNNRFFQGQQPAGGGSGRSTLRRSCWWCGRCPAPRWPRATPPSCAGRSRRWHGCAGRATRR
jgi:tetratricopeptide (TPR) repeat protein